MRASHGIERPKSFTTSAMMKERKIQRRMNIGSPGFVGLAASVSPHVRHAAGRGFAVAAPDGERPAFRRGRRAGSARPGAASGQRLGGAPMLPMKRIVPLSRSRITRRNGRSARKLGGALTGPTPTEVTAAASVPFSLTSRKVFCSTS
jgi:hypothetical protein